MSCAQRIALGAYALGGLDRRERAAVEEHLATCADCRRELDLLAPLPGLLSRVPAAEAQRREHEQPPAALLERLLQAAAATRRRKRARRRLALAGAVAAVAAAVLVLALLPSNAGDPSRPQAVTVAAGDARTGVQASVALGARPWGTRTELRLRGVEPGERCRLVARTADGGSEVAGSWRADYGGRADVPGALSARPEEIVALDVMTVDGRRLVRIPLPG